MPEEPKEEKNTSSNFPGLERGPEMIVKLRQALRAGRFDENTITAVGDFFKEEGYPLSQKQLKVFEQSGKFFQEHRRAALKVKELYSLSQEGLKTQASKLFNCNSDDITNITFHETSITIALKSESFAEQWKKICDYEGVDINEVRQPEGIASDTWLVNVEGNTLPISIEDATKKKDDEIASHENLHVQYRYLHPEEPSHTLTPREYQEQLAKRSAQCIAAEDCDQFRQLMCEVVSKQISTYLNELGSAAYERRRDTYHQAFVDKKNFYYVIFQKRLEQIRKSLPISLSERLRWEEIINIEVARGEQQAAYIDEEYKKLISNPDCSPEMLVAIAEFLTPEQGFLIRAFTEGQLTYERIKNWKKTYEEEQYVKNHEKMINYWVGFIFRHLKIVDEENEPIFKVIREIGEERKKRSLDGPLARVLVEAPEVSNQVDSLSKIEEQISCFKELTKNRVARLRTFLKETNLDFVPPEINKEALRSELFKRAVDFDQVYFEATSDCDLIGVKQSGSQEAEEFMVERNIIFQRSFELDDAAEELIEVLVQNNEPQYEELFARGFKKDDKKRERMKECLNRLGNINTNGTSPLEDDEIDLFKKMIFCSSSERISLIIGNSGLLKRLASACIRILLWAKDNNISDDKLIPIRMFISENYRTRILPMEYKDSIDDGTLNIPLFNVVIEKTQLTETGGTIPDKLK